MGIRRPRNLAVADAVGLALCLTGADWLGAVRQDAGFAPLSGGWTARAAVILATWLLALYVVGAYESRYLRMPGRSLYLTGLAAALALAMCAALFYMIPAWRMNRLAFLVLACVGGMLLGVNRMPWLRRDRLDTVGKVFAIGDPGLLWTVWREMNNRPGAVGSLLLVRCPGPANNREWARLQRVPGIEVCTLADAREALNSNGAQHTFITDGTVNRRDVADLLTEATIRGGLVVDVFSYYELATKKCPIFELHGRWVFSARTQIPTPASLACKRGLDCLLSLLAAPFVLLIVLSSAIAIALESGFPVLYRQRRMGYRGKCFTLLKLRTMRKGAEGATGAVWCEAGDSRITRVGQVLRRTGIDELPQLWNVLLGQMTLVGPRPERPEIVSRLREEIPLYMQRHVVPPGITGWAQIRQASDTCLDDVLEKLRLDLYYAKNFSLGLDLNILLKTGQMLLAGAKPAASAERAPDDGRKRGVSPAG